MRCISLAGLLLLLCTATLAALAPGAQAAAPDTLYFSDDFSGAGTKAFYEGTLDQRRFAYDAGQYVIDTSGSADYGQSVLVEELDTYRAEVTGQLASTSDENGGGFGLSFNYRERAEGSDFMLFLFYDRGAFTVLRYAEGRTAVLLTPTKTKLTKPGESATLSVDAAKGQCTFYINGAEVGTLKEERLVSGGLGMFATANSVVRFDDFRVYAALPAKPMAGYTDSGDGEKRLYEGSWGEVNYGYQAGEYVIDTSATQRIGLSPYSEPALNFELCADVRLVSGKPTGGYGLYIRDWADDSGGFNQYRFLLSGTWFAIEQSVGDLPLALAQWTQSSAIREGALNRLKIRADGKLLAFYINDVEVFRHTDDKPHSGAYGLYASAGLRVAFDNVSFTPLP